MASAFTEHTHTGHQTSCAVPKVDTHSQEKMWYRLQTTTRQVMANEQTRQLVSVNVNEVSKQLTGLSEKLPILVSKIKLALGCANERITR